MNTTNSKSQYWISSQQSYIETGGVCGDFEFIRYSVYPCNMKKILLLTLAIATLISEGYSQSSDSKDSRTLTKNVWEEANLKGKVKSYTESRYNAEDRFGEIQKIEGSLYWKESFKYDDKGNLIEMIGYSNYTFKYDDKGNRMEENYYNADGILSGKVNYNYDDKGNRIEENYYNADGILSGKNTYKYDDKGNQIEGNNYKVDGSGLDLHLRLSGKYTYKYDKKGNQIENNKFNADGILFGKYTYRYDDKGNEIEKNDYNADGSLYHKETYKYDDKGNKIEVNGYSNYTYKYEFDAKGNWIKKITFKNQIPENILERIYQYYEQQIAVLDQQLAKLH